MSPEDRCAILMLLLSAIPADAIVGTGQPRWDAATGDWIEPERRYNLAKILASVEIPPTWQLVELPRSPNIWIDAHRAALCLVYTSKDFALCAPGEEMPRIYPKYVFTADPAQWPLRVDSYFAGYDMREVEARRASEQIKE